MKRYVCTDCPNACTLITNHVNPIMCPDQFVTEADWRPESPAESEAREEQEARAAMESER